MRKILFRGKVINDMVGCNGKFVYGYLTKENNSFYIEVPEMDVTVNAFEVDPETIGQFIGLKDIKGNEVFEGDKFAADEDGEYYLVEYNDKQARFEVSLYGRDMYHNEGGGEEFDSEISRIDTNCFDMDCLSAMEIIGNIHDKTNDK